MKTAVANPPGVGTPVERRTMSDARNRPARTLQRVAFKTSRLAEFCGEKGLTAQTGHAPEDWPLVIAKGAQCEIDAHCRTAAF